MNRVMMKLLSLFHLSLVPLVNAWTFSYTNAANKVITFREDNSHSECTRISLAGGKEFTWNPGDDGVCIAIYFDPYCQTAGGLACYAWDKNASTNFDAISVFPASDSSSITLVTRSTATVSSTPSTTVPASTSATATSTSTSASASTSTSTSSGTPTSSAPAAATTTSSTGNSSSSGSSLSGGAIAGIVVGVVAAVAIVGAMFFFIGRRNRRNAVAEKTHENPNSQGPYSPQDAVSPDTYTQSSSMGMSDKGQVAPAGASFRPAPGSRVVELVGDTNTAELAS